MAYVRIADENILATPVHIALWREARKPGGTMMTYDADVQQLLSSFEERQTLRQVVRLSRLPRPKVVTLLARLVHFGVVRCEYVGQQFLFSLC